MIANNRHVDFWAPIVFIAGLLMFLLSLLLGGVAHATVINDGAPSPVRVIAEPMPIETRLAIWAAGLYAVARTVLELLKVIAPRTKTTGDDWARDTLAEILTHVRPEPPPPEPLPARPEAGFARPLLLVILSGLIVGVGVGLGVVSCATTERAGAAAKVAAVDCGKPQLATAAAVVARWGVEAALAGKVEWSKIETDALGFGLGVGTCAYAEFLRAWKSKPQPTPLALVAQPDPLADAQAGLERLRAQLGGGEIRLADGTVQ